MIGLIFGANRPTVDLAGVRYLVTNQPIRGENLSIAYQRYPTFISENKQAFPRAFLTRRVRTFDDPNMVLKTVATGGANLRDVALLEQQVDPLPYPPDDGAGTVSDIQDSPGKYRMTTNAPASRQLVLTETYHPQWKCTIDGNPAKIYQTDYFFMSVRVPPGAHEVRWWFEPTRFKQGLAVTLASSIFVLAAIGTSRILRRRRLKKAGSVSRS